MSNSTQEILSQKPNRLTLTTLDRARLNVAIPEAIQPAVASPEILDSQISTDNP